MHRTSSEGDDGDGSLRLTHSLSLSHCYQIYEDNGAAAADLTVGAALCLGPRAQWTRPFAHACPFTGVSVEVMALVRWPLTTHRAAVNRGCSSLRSPFALSFSLPLPFTIHCYSTLCPCTLENSCSAGEARPMTRHCGLTIEGKREGEMGRWREGKRE